MKSERVKSERVKSERVNEARPPNALRVTSPCRRQVLRVAVGAGAGAALAGMSNAALASAAELSVAIARATAGVPELVEPQLTRMQRAAGLPAESPGVQP